MPPIKGRFRELHYTQYGFGRPVIALHGFGQTSYSWRHLAFDTPNELGFYVFDLRGCGESAKPRDEHYSMQDQADLICAFIHENDLRDATLIGHSMGGGIALLATLKLLKQRGRLHSLVLVDSLAPPQRIPWFIRTARIPIVGPLALACAPSRVVCRAIMHQAYHDPAAIEDDAVAAYARNLASAGGRFALHKSAQLIVPDDIDRIIANYSSINIPTLIVWGDDDRIIPPQQGAALRDLIPGSRLSTLEKCGHIPHEERPRETILLIRTFLIEAAQ